MDKILYQKVYQQKRAEAGHRVYSEGEIIHQTGLEIEEDGAQAVVIRQGDILHGGWPEDTATVYVTNEEEAHAIIDILSKRFPR